MGGARIVVDVASGTPPLRVGRRRRRDVGGGTARAVVRCGAASHRSPRPGARARGGPGPRGEGAVDRHARGGILRAGRDRDPFEPPPRCVARARVPARGDRDVPLGVDGGRAQLVVVDGHLRGARDRRRPHRRAISRPTSCCVDRHDVLRDADRRGARTPLPRRARSRRICCGRGTCRRTSTGASSADRGWRSRSRPRRSSRSSSALLPLRLPTHASTWLWFLASLLVAQAVAFGIAWHVGLLAFRAGKHHGAPPSEGDARRGAVGRARSARSLPGAAPRRSLPRCRSRR